MQPYNYIYHIVDDIINENTSIEYSYLCFEDNIRYKPLPVTDEPGESIETGYRVLKSKYDYKNTKSNSTYNNGKWVNNKSHGGVNSPVHGGIENAILKYHFLEHCWEPVYYTFDKSFWDDFVVFQKKYNIEQTVIHSEHNSWDIVQLKKQGIKTVHWFSHAYLCSEFYFNHYRKLEMVTNYKSRPIQYHWVCANRLIDIPRDYRIKFLNLLDTSTGVYSLLDKDPYTNRKLEEIYPDNIVKPNSFDDHSNHSAEIEINDLTPWNASFLHVVNETVWQDKIHFTEKVFKPIVLHQPFVVLQAPGSLEYLRSYGFRTFDDWWDESYDAIEDPAERMQAIADIVNAIGNKSLEELETMRIEMASVLEHNFRHFYENIPAICLDELRKGIATL